MAFHEISIMDVWDIIRRWHDRHSISQIAQALSCDRKTVRGYVRLAQSVGLSLAQPLPEKEDVVRLLQNVDRHIGRTPQAQTLLLPYLDEISLLINDPQLALKPKSAFTVICERHNLSVSYPSYARFIRANSLALDPTRVTCRVEVEPGTEVQIDYARICMMLDPSVNRRRKLFAFIATLSHSRMKYVELTFSQDQTSFVNSHIRMFEFFGGVPYRAIVDNLKSGVIKSDLYDPHLNRAYREMSEYYTCFIDPARVRHPKDKGKVERDVQTVREAARMIIVQNPGASLAELNRLIKDWALNTYGQREHGTTREKPLTVLREREQPALKPLPSEPFVVAQWKKATVHPDHYIQFRAKAYSVPHAYVGKVVWVRATERVLKVFFNEQLIKQHVITGAYRHTDYDDFPENVRASLDTNFIHRKLLERASKIGPLFHRIIGDLLSAHAFINLRRAQGLMTLAESVLDHTIVEAAAALIEVHGLKATPQVLRRLLAKLHTERSTPNLLPLSAETSEFVRDINYFINNNNERPT